MSNIVEQMARLRRTMGISQPEWVQWVLAGGVIAALVLHTRTGRDRLPLLAVALIVMFTMITAQRVVPPPRSWMYLQPVYLVTAAAGLVAIWGVLGKRIPAVARAWIGAGSAAVVAVYLGWLTFSGAHTTMWFANPVYDAADRIALRVGGDIGPDDAILSLSKDYPSIRFYLFEHFGEDGVDFANWTQISREGMKPQRVYIIVIVRDGIPEGSPEDGIKIRGLDPADYTSPEVVEMYEGVVLYVAYRR
jgi:hypothetical protein